MGTTALHLAVGPVMNAIHPYSSLVAVALVALAATGCERSQASTPTPSSASETTAEDTGSLPCSVEVVASQHGGMCYAHNWQHGGRDGYGSETSRASLVELQTLGMQWVSITPFGWQSGLQSSEIRQVGSRAAETDQRLEQTIEQAHALGLKVMMKPHIWLSYSEWRGHIDPGSPEGWRAWFASYTEFILRYARLSEQLRADMFVIGVEFGSSTVTHAAEWREVIRQIRAAYSGPIIYAANWDEVERVPFWDALDYIGIQMFAPLSDTPGATREALRSQAADYVERVRVLSERFDRPVILTEVGYKSIQGTAVSPFTWPEHLPAQGTIIDEGAQADAYCAILETFGQADYVAGMYWWKWFTDPDTDEEGATGFSPRGKLAERVLRIAYGR